MKLHRNTMSYLTTSFRLNLLVAVLCSTNLYAEIPDDTVVFRETTFYGLVLSEKGHIESADHPVESGRLFRQQLDDRIGKEQAKKGLK